MVGSAAQRAETTLAIRKAKLKMHKTKATQTKLVLIHLSMTNPLEYQTLSKDIHILQQETSNEAAQSITKAGRIGVSSLAGESMLIAGCKSVPELSRPALSTFFWFAFCMIVCSCWGRM